MNEQNSPDIDAGTIGTGCATGFGIGCLQLVLMVALLAMSGFNMVSGRLEDVPGVLKIVGFLMGGAGNVLIGYVTARKAPRAKMLHAIIVGALAILCGIVSVTFNPQFGGQNSLNLLAYLIAIPLNMLGAQWAISSEETKPPSR